MTTLDGDWAAIAAILVWRRGGDVVVTRKMLAELPEDRVGIYDTDEPRPGALTFRWITPAAARAEAARKAKAGKERAGVEKLEGRWEKIAWVLLWQFARDGAVFTLQDKESLPPDRVMLTVGKRDHVHYRFVSRTEAARIQKWERDNEGKEIVEGEPFGN